MTARRRFTADFKARVALAALRGDKTIQEIATKHKVHPNQVSRWKRPAGQTPAEAYAAGRPMDMMDKPRGLPTSPQGIARRFGQAQQQQEDMINKIQAA